MTPPLPALGVGKGSQMFLTSLLIAHSLDHMDPNGTLAKRLCALDQISLMQISAVMAIFDLSQH